MGIAILKMTRSQRLRELIVTCETVETDEHDGREWLHDACDMTSTAGYDNDGSTGPELLDNGVALAFAARDYDPKAVIFYAFGEQNPRDCFTTAYYVYGKDEDDAIRRLREALAELLAIVEGD